VISYGRHSINKSDVKSVARTLNSEWLTIGPLVSKFESKISEIISMECFVVSSGTAALHCAYAAIDLKPGDEVITPPITFIATQSTAMHFGAKIVFCDVDSKTGNMDYNLVEALITNKTKAITVVDYAGHPAHLREFRKIADKYNLFLIEDAAHSLGSKYFNLPVGSFADLTTYSFFPTKNITTGEGGAVASNNSILLDKARKFGRQGLIKDKSKFIYTADGPWHQEVHKIGLNYRLPDILCALGISQIGRINEFKNKRQKIFDMYTSELCNEPLIELPVKEEFADPFWHLFPIRIKGGLRDQLFKNLWENNIFVQVNYVPAYFHPVFMQSGYNRGICPIAETFYSQEISLPLHSELKKKEIKLIIRIIREFLRKNIVNEKVKTNDNL